MKRIFFFADFQLYSLFTYLLLMAHVTSSVQGQTQNFISLPTQASIDTFADFGGIRPINYAVNIMCARAGGGEIQCGSVLFVQFRLRVSQKQNHTRSAHDAS
jgi:hypothetical protein